MTNKPTLKEKIQSGCPVIGTWSVIPSVVVADIVAASGLDFLIIDAEHGPIDFQTAQNMVIACDSRGVTPAMRVGGVIAQEILRALDIGVSVIHIPNICNLVQLQEAARCCKYPPRGTRGFSPFNRAGGYSPSQSKFSTEQSNNSTLLAVHVEGSLGLANLDQLLTSREVDIVFVGLYDLSVSLGIPGETDSPIITKAVSELVTKVTNAGKCPGTIVNNVKQLALFLDMGMRYITFSVDCQMLMRSYQEACKSFRNLSNQE